MSSLKKILLFIFIVFLYSLNISAVAGKKVVFINKNGIISIDDHNKMHSDSKSHSHTESSWCSDIIKKHHKENQLLLHADQRCSKKVKKSDEKKRTKSKKNISLKFTEEVKEVSLSTLRKGRKNNICTKDKSMNFTCKKSNSYYLTWKENNLNIFASIINKDINNGVVKVSSLNNKFLSIPISKKLVLPSPMWSENHKKIIKKIDIPYVKKNITVYTKKDKNGCKIELSLSSTSNELEYKYIDCWESNFSWHKNWDSQPKIKGHQSFQPDKEETVCKQIEDKKVRCWTPSTINSVSEKNNGISPKEEGNYGKKFEGFTRSFDAGDLDNEIRPVMSWTDEVEINGKKEEGVRKKIKRMLENGYTLEYQYILKNEQKKIEIDRESYDLTMDVINGTQPFADFTSDDFDELPYYIRITIHSNDKYPDSCLPKKRFWNGTIGYKKSTGSPELDFKSKCEKKEVIITNPDKLNITAMIGEKSCTKKNDTLTCSISSSNKSTISITLNNMLGIEKIEKPPENGKIEIKASDFKLKTNDKINELLKKYKVDGIVATFSFCLNTTKCSNEIKVDSQKYNVPLELLDKKTPRYIKLEFKNNNNKCYNKNFISIKWNIVENKVEKKIGKISPKLLPIKLNAKGNHLKNYRSLDYSILLYKTSESCNGIEEGQHLFSDENLDFKDGYIKGKGYPRCYDNLWARVLDSSYKTGTKCVKASIKKDEWYLDFSTLEKPPEKDLIYTLILNDQLLNKHLKKENLSQQLKSLIEKGIKVYRLNNEGIKISFINSSGVQGIDYSAENLTPFELMGEFIDISNIEMEKTKHIFVITARITGDEPKGMLKNALDSWSEKGKITYLSLQGCEKGYGKVDCRKIENISTIEQIINEKLGATKK